jgi:hypothetical protein
MDGIAVNAMANTKLWTAAVRIIVLPPEREKPELAPCGIDEENKHMIRQTQWKAGKVSKYSGEKRGQKKTRDSSLRSE